MIEFFFAEYNTFYAIAICFVFILTLLEGLGALIGFSLMSIADQLISLDVDTDVDVSSGGLTSIIGWLCLNRLPLLVWLVIILSSFGFFGYSFNYVSLIIFSDLLPFYLVVILSITFAIYFTKAVSKPLAKLLPQNETSAISNHSFSGLVGKITIGKATYNNPAEAVLHDQFGQKHYILVAPESSGIQFDAGSEVVLIEKLENHWLAMPFNSNNI